MNRSESIGALAKALAAAQKEMDGAAKVKLNPHLKSKYADMESVVDAIKAPLAKYGISYTQLNEPSERNEVRVETVLMHESGEWVSGVIALPVSKTDPQGFGSAMTYARRYALMAIVGIAAEDDDGLRATLAGDGQDSASADLLAKMDVAVSSGMDAYKKFWTSITEADRTAIGVTRHEANKKTAATVAA